MLVDSLALISSTDSIGKPSSATTLGRTGGRHPLGFLARNRYQLLGATLLAVLLPMGLRHQLVPWERGFDAINNAAIGSFAAILLGAYLLRRMASYPGVRSLAYLLPAFGTAFLCVFAIFLLGRFEYSRFLFATSFVLAIVWFGFIGYLEPRIRRPRLMFLPFGHGKELPAVGQADWVLGSDPGQLPTGVSGIVADLRNSLPADWERFLARASLAGIPVYHSKQVQESLTGRVEIEHLSENTFGSLVPSSMYVRAKSLGDFILAVCALPFAAVICAIAAIAIRIEDGGRAIFRQQRIGRGGRPFTMLKLRTMEEGIGGKPFTEENDPRVTRVGRWLRRSHIDELPQIINILRGEMSWIGPRPESLTLAADYECQIPFYCYRHIVQPGITGWAQVHQGNVAEVAAATGKLHYDFYYIKHLSPWLDVLIAAKTARAILTGFGAR